MELMARHDWEDIRVRRVGPHRKVRWYAFTLAVPDVDATPQQIVEDSPGVRSPAEWRASASRLSAADGGATRLTSGRRPRSTSRKRAVGAIPTHARPLPDGSACRRRHPVAQAQMKLPPPEPGSEDRRCRRAPRRPERSRPGASRERAHEVCRRPDTLRQEAPRCGRQPAHAGPGSDLDGRRRDHDGRGKEQHGGRVPRRLEDAPRRGSRAAGGPRLPKALPRPHRERRRADSAAWRETVDVRRSRTISGTAIMPMPTITTRTGPSSSSAARIAPTPARPTIAASP